MAENESNIIGHLIEVENLAASVTENAEEQALKKINAVKAQAELDYHEKFSAQVKELENSFNERAAKIDENIKNELSTYKEEISKSPLDTASFKAFMDKLISEKKAVHL